jgi:hypothetical protein
VSTRRTLSHLLKGLCGEERVLFELSHGPAAARSLELVIAVVVGPAGDADRVEQTLGHVDAVVAAVVAGGAPRVGTLLEAAHLVLHLGPGGPDLLNGLVVLGQVAVGRVTVLGGGGRRLGEAGGGHLGGRVGGARSARLVQRVHQAAVVALAHCVVVVVQLRAGTAQVTTCGRHNDAETDNEKEINSGFLQQ